jgi:CRP-like cAMP-binding protein
LEELLKKIKSSMHLRPEAEAYFKSISNVKVVTKGEILIRQGDTVDRIFFVNDGCLRSYCIDKSGKEHTLQFAVKDWWISDYIGIHSNEPATLTVECLSDANIIEFDSKKINEIYTRFPEFEPFQRRNLERHIVSLQKRILNQLQLSAAERYDLFLAQYGDIEKYVPNYHIASYLGITQESLSRIRVQKTKK